MGEVFCFKTFADEIRQKLGPVRLIFNVLGIARAKEQRKQAY
jgi:hypothetical protein